LGTLREALAELKAQEPERGIRWDRAAAIVALRTIKPGYTSGTWVESECETGKWYWVLQVPSGNWTCICPDYQQRGGPCKHALAVRLLQACEAKEAARVAASQPCAACGQPDLLTAGLCEPCIRREAAHDPDAPIPYVLTPQAEAALAEPTFGDILLDGECPTCGALGRVLWGGRRARCEYCAC
jgi:hypothetical protein